MNFKMLPLLALAALPAMAQERWQVGVGFNGCETKREDYVNAASLSNYKRDSGTGIALQAAYRFKHFASSDLTVTGEYQFNTHYDTSANGRSQVTTSNGVNYPFSFTGRMDKEFFAPGILWNFHPTIDIGFGLQYRFERLHGALGPVEVSTRNDRPWFNFYWGYTFQNEARVKPFLALRSSVALASTTRPANDADIFNTDGGQRKLLRSMAGDSEASLQVGVRF